jgi:hypothetical protein
MIANAPASGTDRPCESCRSYAPGSELGGHILYTTCNLTSLIKNLQSISLTAF